MYHRLYWTTILLVIWHLSTQPDTVNGILRTFDSQSDAAAATASAAQTPDTEPQPVVKDPDKMMKESQTKIQRAVSSEHMYQQSSIACEAFVVGDPEKPNVIYSPGYPNNYPNNTDCVRVLEAEVGKVLRLDFRDSFNMEPSDDCKFDFLEIRDGEHGFSNKLGQYCGHEFPPIITSTDRFLWLHFKSDDNIEYSGFTAVYESIDSPSNTMSRVQECDIKYSGHEGIVNRTDVESFAIMSRRFGVALDCMWTITVNPGWQIQLTFEKFKLERPNDCDSNFLDIFDERTDIPSRKKNFCGSVAGELITFFLL